MEIVDSTKLTDSLNCLRYFQLRHELGLVPKDEYIGLPLIFGSAIHAALDELYTSASVVKAMQAFDEVWAGREGDHKRNPAAALRILSEYILTYPNEAFTVIATERPFVVPLTDQIAWAGIVDLVGRIDDQLFIMDHKTASQIAPSYWAQYDAGASIQEIGYLYAVSQLVGQVVRTFAVNVILVDRDKTGFQRRFYVRREDEVVQWKETITNWWSIVLACRQAGQWPKNPHYCGRWGRCQYIDICSTGHITSDFDVCHWDPLSKLK